MFNKIKKMRCRFEFNILRALLWTSKPQQHNIVVSRVWDNNTKKVIDVCVDGLGFVSIQRNKPAELKQTA